MKAVYVGKNPPGSSMYLVGQQIAGHSGATLCTGINEKMKGCDVISIVPEDTPKIVSAKKFIGVGQITTLLAANWEEFGLWERSAMLGFATENKLVVHSPHSYQEVMKTAKELLSPAKMRAITNNLSMIPYGVGLEFKPTKRNPLNWIVPYNRINASQKNMPMHNEISTKFAISMRGKVDHLFIVFDALSVGKTTDKSVYTVVPQPPTREEYVQLIADRGAFLCTSNYESFGIYYLELLCSGCVGVFLDKPWIKSLLPDYKLVAKDKAEALALMKYVTKNYEMWQDYVKTETIPFIRSNYDLKEFSEKLMEV